MKSRYNHGVIQLADISNTRSYDQLDAKELPIPLRARQLGCQNAVLSSVYSSTSKSNPTLQKSLRGLPKENKHMINAASVENSFKGGAAKNMIIEITEKHFGIMATSGGHSARKQCIQQRKQTS